MQTLSYTISPVLQQTLKDIETTRERILLHPLSPDAEIKYQWEAALSRIYFSLHLAHNPVTEKEIIRALMSPSRRSTLPAEKDIVNYKRGRDYIYREWFVNAKPVMPSTIQKLSIIATGEKMHIPEDQLMEILVFLQTSRENALIQAFIAYIQFSMLFPVNDNSGKLARLLPYLFLYKNGLDFRGLLVLESYFYKNERLMRELREAIERKESVSVWIEHFAQGIASQLRQTLETISQGSVSEENPNVAKLTERQKEILTSFDVPNTRITNKMVQQMFRISQITASRDLAKLSALGLVFQYGKGRSVYYMKV